MDDARSFRDGVSDRAKALIDTSFVCDIVWPEEPRYDNTYESLDRFHRSGVDLVSVTLAGDLHNVSEAVQMVAKHRRLVLDQPDRLVLVEKPADIERARAERKLGVMFHFEGTRCFERNLDMIAAFFTLGIRFTLPAFNQTNSVGGGCGEEVDPGLTRLGRSFVHEMERVGMLLDLSHTGYRTTMDAMDMATKPVIFSHCCVDALHPHVRNLKDDQMKACAALGGVIGLSGNSMYLGDDDCRTETLFKHIDYMVELLGPEHVGLGLDVIFKTGPLDDWLRARPDEWPYAADPDWPGVTSSLPEQIPELVDVMLEKGYDEAAIVGILGGNYLRVFRALWD